MSVYFLDSRKSDALLARARTFLEDININDEFLNTINQWVYDIFNQRYAYENVREKIGKEASQEKWETLLARITNVLAPDIIAAAPEYRIAFLLDLGRREDELKAEISGKPPHVPEPS